MADLTGSHHDPLDAVIAEYLQQVEAGAVPDREALLATHPGLADRLREFFADYDRIDRQAGDLRLSVDPNRTSDPAEAAADLPRVRYFGDYELLEVIARGGMGVVYKARQVSLDRTVALKMLLKGELATPRDEARFQAEAEAAAGLDYPNIVPIYEVGAHDGRRYFSMKYVESGSLAKLPRGDARTEAGRLAVIARAVHFAHQRGVLHRDLKPGNVLIDGRGQPIVADFGLAKRVDVDQSLSETGAVVGTPRYMAPEQAAGRKDLTVAADVYSLGVVLYERLTGRTPFSGETILDILRQAREHDPPRPSSITPGLSRDLETIVLKCLEKKPDRRYATAAEFADDLERFTFGRPVRARPVGTLGRVGRWVRRNPALATAVAAVMMALSAGVAGITWASFQARLERRRALTSQLRMQQTLNAIIADVLWPEKEENQLRNQTERPLSVEKREFLATVLRHYEVYAGGLGQSRDDRAAAANASFHIGRIRCSIGETDRGLEDLRRAVDIGTELTRNFPAETAYWEDLSLWHVSVGHVLARVDRWPDAVESYQAHHAVRRKLTADSGVKGARPAVGRPWGQILAKAGRFPEAEAAFRAALSEYEREAARYPGPFSGESDWATTRSSLGCLLAGMNRWTEAEEVFRSAVAFHESRVVEASIPEPRRRFVALSKFELASFLSQTNRPDEANAIALTIEPRALFEAAHEYQPPLIMDYAARISRVIAMMRCAAVNGFCDIRQIIEIPENAPLRKHQDFIDLLWDIADTPSEK